MLEQIDKSLFEVPGVAPLQEEHILYAITHFKGFVEEMNSLIAYLNDKDIYFIEVPGEDAEVKEIKTHAEGIPELVTKFPVLRVTGLRENFETRFVEVWFSESGAPVITQIALTDYFEGHAEGGSGRWAWDVVDDITDKINTCFDDHYAEGQFHVHYEYPAEWGKLWRRKDGLIQVKDGNYFIESAQNVSDDFEIKNGVLIGYYGHDSVIEIPEGVQKIKSGVFGHVVADTIIIPGSVKSVGTIAKGNPYIKKLVFKSGVETIAESAFEGCKSLKLIELPETITAIRSMAFLWCDDLKLDIESLPHALKNIAGLVTCKSIDFPDILLGCGGKVLLYCRQQLHVTIPDGVKSIAPWAFKSGNIMKTITLPDSLRSIPVFGFEGLAGLKKVSIPNGVKKIPANCFGGCESLSEIQLPIGCTEIAESAFVDCKSLKTANIPDSIKKLYSFPPVKNENDLPLPSKLQEVGDHAFEGCRNRVMRFPDGVKKIGADLFTGRTLSWYQRSERGKITKDIRLEALWLPESLESIGTGAFAGCCKLKKVYIPGTISHIPNEMFFECTSLETVVFGDGVTSLGGDVFKWCEHLKDVYFCGKIDESVLQYKVFGKPLNVTLHGKEGSNVRELAVRCDKRFELLDEEKVSQLIDEIRSMSLNENPV